MADVDGDLNAAVSHFRAGRWSQAEGVCRWLLAHEPRCAGALHLLGLIALRTGRAAEALDLLRRAVELAPEVAGYRSDLAGVLGQAGHAEEALVHLLEAVRLDPSSPPVRNNLGMALSSLGRLDEAEAAYRQAVCLSPGYAEAHNNLGHLLRKLGRATEAVACHRRAVELKPHHGGAWAALAAALVKLGLGHLDEAIRCYRRAVTLRPGDAALHSALLFTLHYHPGVTPEELFEEHREWARRHAEPLRGTGFQHLASPGDHGLEARATADRRLRVGYVSADFRRHTRAAFVEPVLEHHDRSAVELFCYSDVPPHKADETTARFRAVADVWRETSGLSDAPLADLIRSDGIDVLVELTGHMGGNRLLVFARRPAPVQVAYPGYPNTTGLPQIDYLITDEDRDPPGAERLYTEKLVRLPTSSQCYRPPDEAPAVGELPALAKGHVTFGCLNKLVKVTPQVARLWSRILEQVSGSRLLVLGAHSCGAGFEPASGTEQAESLHHNGIDPQRLDVAGRGTRAHYITLYHRIDIALDTFPYNGHTTTLDAAWMGVPTVTLAGQSHLSREGLAVLKLLGLGELVAVTAEQYVEIAVRLASDLPALAELRRGMRERMERSPLCDGPRVAGAVEEAYRAMPSLRRLTGDAATP